MISCNYYCNNFNIKYNNFHFIHSVTGKLTRGVKTPINNLMRAKIKIDRGRSGLTWFETGTYTKTILTELDVNHMQQ